MPKLSKKTVTELQHFAKSQMNLVRFYETKGQFETAYLARWAILEKFVRAVDTEYRRVQLRHALAEWFDYLDGKRQRRPTSKLDPNVEAAHLPGRRDFVAALNFFKFDGARLWRVMDSKGKPRGFRNQIAHTGRRFTKERQYRKLSKLLEEQAQKAMRW